MANEMEKLIILLVTHTEDIIKKGLKYDMRTLRGKPQVVLYKDGSRIADVICDGYGSEKGLLEMYSLLTPEEAEYDDVTVVDAEEVIKRILNYETYVIV